MENEEKELEQERETEIKEFDSVEEEKKEDGQASSKKEEKRLSEDERKEKKYVSKSFFTKTIITMMALFCGVMIFFARVYQLTSGYYLELLGDAYASVAQSRKPIATTTVKPVIINENVTPSELNIAAIAQGALPSLVSITKLNTPHKPGFNCLFTEDGNLWDATSEVAGYASGVIFASDDEEILILTNGHVVDDAKSIIVTFCNDKNVLAYVKGYSEVNTDIAVIAVKIADIDQNTLNSVACITLGDSDELFVGENVVAIGNASGYGQTVTTGVVGALHRAIQPDLINIPNAIQISAGLSPGNSGGALLNAKGELVGITSAKPTDTLSEGVGFAIPINDVKDLLEVLSAKESRMYTTEEEKVQLGINVSDTYLGIMVVDITQGMPAYNSDLQVGDIIKQFNGDNVLFVDALLQKIRYCLPGDEIAITVERPNGKEYKTETIIISISN